MQKIVIEIDGDVYGSLTEGAQAIGATPTALLLALKEGRKCKGHNVRYADGSCRDAGHAVRLMARWYTKEWRDYISSDALVSLTDYIRKHWKDEET